MPWVLALASGSSIQPCRNDVLLYIYIEAGLLVVGFAQFRIVQGVKIGGSACVVSLLYGQVSISSYIRIRPFENPEMLCLVRRIAAPQIGDGIHCKLYCTPPAKSSLSVARPWQSCIDPSANICHDCVLALLRMLEFCRRGDIRRISKGSYIPVPTQRAIINSEAYLRTGGLPCRWRR